MMISSKLYIFQVILYLYVFSSQITALENKIINGGSCLYKISSDFTRCNTRQHEKIKSQTKSYHSYTQEEKQIALNKVACCAYWEFLECVQTAARIYCKENARDIEKHSENLGTTVPLYICREEYPKGSFKCKIPVWLILVVVIAVVVILTFAVFVFICVRNSR